MNINYEAMYSLQRPLDYSRTPDTPMTQDKRWPTLHKDNKLPFQ